jgi:hypothetical protein
MKRIVCDDAVKPVLRQWECIEIRDDPVWLALKSEPPCSNASPLYALGAEINGRQIHSARGELECQITLPAAEFENTWSIGERAIKKSPVFLAKENLEELRIMPDLGILRVLPDLAPVARLLSYQLIVVLRFSHRVCARQGTKGEEMPRVSPSRNKEVL